MSDEVDVKFTHNGKDKKIVIGELFDIDDTDLTKEFAKQASLYAYFATTQADAERELAMADSIKDQEYATADEFFRKEKEEQGHKYTEAVIKSLIMRDEDYLKVLLEYTDADHNVNVLKAITRALQMRAEMLISLG